MSDDASIEWKSYSRPDFSYVAGLPGSRQHYIFKSKMLGTRSLYECAKVQSAMSTQVRRNVLRLRTSKSLTCDASNAQLSEPSPSAMRPSTPFGYSYAASRTFGRTSSPSSGSGSSSQAWNGETDPIQDFRDWAQRMRENDHAMYQRMAGMRGDDHALHQRLSQVQR